MAIRDEPLFESARERERTRLSKLIAQMLTYTDRLRHVYNRHKQGRNWRAPLARLASELRTLAEDMGEDDDESIDLSEGPQPPAATGTTP